MLTDNIKDVFIIISFNDKLILILFFNLLYRFPLSFNKFPGTF